LYIKLTLRPGVLTRESVFHELTTYWSSDSIFMCCFVVFNLFNVMVFRHVIAIFQILLNEQLTCFESCYLPLVNDCCYLCNNRGTRWAGNNSFDSLFFIFLLFLIIKRNALSRFPVI